VKIQSLCFDWRSNRNSGHAIKILDNIHYPKEAFIR